MIRLAAAVLIASVLLLAPVLSPTASAADPDTDDVRCVIVYLQMAQSKDEMARNSGMFGQLYWLGKLDGRHPGFDLEPRLVAEIPKMSEALFKGEAMRCSAELLKRGEKEADMGEDIARKNAVAARKDGFTPAAPAAPAAKPAAAPQSKSAEPKPATPKP